ncbi:MAG TPA: VWA domain-containing protein [Iamia sp.]|nr:VWA domain-containing protein [Iamia sp.]
MSRRRLASVAAAGAALATVLSLLTGGAALASGPVAPARQTEPDPAADDPAADPAEDRAAGTADPFDRLAACVGAEGRLLVVLLVDESASLRETDPDDQRVAAARAALRSIDLLRGTDAAGGSIAIDVLVSTFSFDFATVGDWSPLTEETRGAVDDRIAGLADRDESMDTDFHNALDGARRALADRATESTEAAGGNVCKAILLFTDGSYTLGARTTEAQRERFGTTKTYAPDIVLDRDEAVREATGLGVAALCREGGVADQVRADNITLVSVPLGEGSGLLEALTTGSSEERDCGDPETDTPGAYLPAPDTDELLRTFDLVASRIGGGSPVGEPARLVPCDDDVCDEGAVTFAVSPSLRRVHVFAAVPGDETRVVLRPPEGDDLELEPGADADEDVAGIPVVARWIADRAVTIDLAVPPDGTGAGDWSVVLVGPEGDATGLVQVVTFSDLVARLEPGTSLLLGGVQTLAATITTRDGAESSEELRDPRVTATLVDPITGSVATVELGAGEDGFSGNYSVPDDVTSSALRASLRLEATTPEGAAITSVAPETVLSVRRPEGYPQLVQPVLELTPVVGDDAAEGVLTVVVPDGADGCIWIEDLTVDDGPKDAGDLLLTAEGVGRDEGECTEIDGGLSVDVLVEAADKASGSVVGHVRVVVARTDGEAPIPTDVPITFEMSRGIDEAKRLLLAAGLMLGGLLAPLLLLVLINLLTTRFPDLGHVRAARVPVVVTRNGQVLRTDGGLGTMHLMPSDFESLAGRGRRRFTWGGLVFGARTALNPFAEPYATVAPEEGTADVSREGRRTDLDLGLVGSWLFLLDQDASRAATAGEVHGILVAFASEGDEAGQGDRIAGSVLQRGPTVSRRLAVLAGLSMTGA